MSSNWQGAERRNKKRSNINFIITYKIKNTLKIEVEAEIKEINALLLDLSESGVAISTTENIVLGTTLTIKLILVDYTTNDKDERIKTREVIGIVRDNVSDSVGRRRIGVSFVDLNDEVRSVIACFIKKTTG